MAKRSSYLRTSLNPITSDLMLFYLSSSSSSCTFSTLSNVRRPTLYVATFSRSRLVVVFLDAVLALPRRTWTTCYITDTHATGDWGPCPICTLHAGLHGLPFHAGRCCRIWRIISYHYYSLMPFLSFSIGYNRRQDRFASSSTRQKALHGQLPRAP